MPLSPIANSNAALTRNTPRIPRRADAIPASASAANCASEVNDAEAPLTRPRSSGGVSPCNIVPAAIITTATPIPMQAAPNRAAAMSGTTAISRIDAPTPAMPPPIRRRGSPLHPLKTEEPARVPAASNEAIIANTAGPRCKTSRT